MSKLKIRLENIKKTISLMLRTAGVKQSNVDALLSNENMRYFSEALTHKSYDPDNNYEVVESIGDITLNYCMVEYMTRKWGNIGKTGTFLSKKLNPHTFSKLRQYLISNKVLSLLSNKYGLMDLLLINKENDPKLMGDWESEYKKISGDVFEAVLGTIDTLLNKDRETLIGPTICYNIVSKTLEQINLKIRFEDLMDPVTRLKEAFFQLGWGERLKIYDYFKPNDPNILFSVTQSTAQDPSKKYKADILFWYNGSQLVTNKSMFRPESRRFRVVEIFDNDKNEAKNKAALKALDLLKGVPGIEDKRRKEFDFLD